MDGDPGRHAGDYPPTDPDGFLAFARSLRFPDIHQVIRDGEPLDDPVGFRFPASVRHRYERLPRFPDGLLVVGDAVCSFNPIYGQGMSVAALEALALRRIRARRGPAADDWFRELARVVDAVGDRGRRRLRLPRRPRPPYHQAATGQRLPGPVPRRRHPDADLAGVFMRVAGLVAPPRSLLRPGVAARVLRATQLRRRAPRIPPAPRGRADSSERGGQRDRVRTTSRGPATGSEISANRSSSPAGLERTAPERARHCGKA